MTYRSYVSQYFTKEAILQTWNQELYGVGILGPFTENNALKRLIPDPESLVNKDGHGGRRQTRRIRGDMDESEAGKAAKRCSQCGVVGHTYKRCPLNEFPAAAEAGPSGNPADGRPPDFQSASGSSGRRRRSVSSRSGLV
jgi:hypothetical protein